MVDILETRRATSRDFLPGVVVGFGVAAIFVAMGGAAVALSEIVKPGDGIWSHVVEQGLPLTKDEAGVLVLPGIAVTVGTSFGLFYLGMMGLAPFVNFRKFVHHLD